MLRRIASGQVLTEHVWSLLLDVRGSLFLGDPDRFRDVYKARKETACL
jgi:hypothetical protein